MNNAPKIFVPLLDNGNGQVMATFMVDHFEAFKDRNVVIQRASDSHANRGMNKVACDFLKSDCDVWINIDADIRFTSQNIDDLLKHDLPLVYGIYPKKEDATHPCFCTFEKLEEPDANGLTEIRRSGRGFMLVKREVLEAMKEDNGGPALRYHNHEVTEWDFFPSGPVEGEMSFMGTKNKDTKPEDIAWPKDADGFPMREWISEDWYFCERARKLGYKTVVDSSIALGHVGQKEYRFNAQQVTRMDAFITSWEQIHGWFDYEDFYKELALRIPDGGRFVEIGSWLGRSIGAFCEFTKKIDKNIEIHVTDNFEGEPENPVHEAILRVHGGSIERMFRQNIQALGLDEKIVVHAKDSVLAAADFEDNSVDAIFIDGNHHELAVKADIEAWLPKIKPGGIISGHDIDEKGVAKAVTEAFGYDVQVKGRCWAVKLRGSGD